MATVQEIEDAIRRLDAEEFRQFCKWFHEYEDEIWDRQIERDAESGKLDPLVNEAMAEYRAGKAKEL